MNESQKQRVYKALCEDAQDAILYADHEGIIRFWNLGAEKVFGHSAENAVGQSLDLIIPDHLRQRHNEGYEKVMSTGQTKYGNQLLSVPALNKNKEKLFTDFSIVMVKDETGRMLGVAAIMRDSTQQKLREKNLRQKVQACGQGKRMDPEDK